MSLNGFLPRAFMSVLRTPFLVIATLCSIALAPSTLAAPSTLVGRQQDTSSSGGNNKAGGMKAQIFVPIVIVALLLIALVFFTWSRGSWSIRNFGAAAAMASGTVVAESGSNTASTRELTAELLTGSNDSPATTPTPAATAQPRRNRRNRRTPSQRSTKSLPAYNKEPGDEELVIYRAPDDPEAVEINLDTMPVVREDGLESSDSSFTISRTNTREQPQYDDLPETPHDMPLLSSDQFNPSDLSGQTLAPPQGNDARYQSSFETLVSAPDSHSDPERRASQENLPDPRGEAPPYFEVVEGPDATASRVSESVDSPVPPSAPSPVPAPASPSPEPPRSRHSQQTSDTSRRRSIFGFFNRVSTSSPVPVLNVTASDRLPSTHSRTESQQSGTSTVSTSNEGHSRARSRATSHRPSMSSSSGSAFFRPLSRQRSPSQVDNTLNSPSMISLNSISSPLAHTLVRTEFTYPKTGLTPEQLKLISSRESIARFGVPYGADAIAYHSSRSGVNLAPPPGFDEVISSPTPSFAAAPSGAVGSDQGSMRSSEEVEQRDDARAVTRQASFRTAVSVGIPSSDPQEDMTDGIGDDVAPVSPSDSIRKEPVGEEATPAEEDPSHPPLHETNSAPRHLRLPHFPSSTSLSARSGTGIPPSAFKTPTPNSTLQRSESRASSYVSFATADESFRPSSPSSMMSLPRLNIITTASNSNLSMAARTAGGESPGSSAPPTPRVNATLHLREETDTTATPSPSTPTLPSISVH